MRIKGKRVMRIGGCWQKLGIVHDRHELLDRCLASFLRVSGSCIMQYLADMLIFVKMGMK